MPKRKQRVEDEEAQSSSQESVEKPKKRESNQRAHVVKNVKVEDAEVEETKVDISNAGTIERIQLENYYCWRGWKFVNFLFGACFSLLHPLL